ncbi:MAG: ATP-binding cassette domain-containing protein, partial [Deltaproteobacteria bacterium]|nr:ATP-binding cassette domain-containing protein [Deltaproteobacteria bacterium]
MQLDVKGLNTYYGESHVLQDMSVAVNNGEIVALLGRNGMGKSTTLKSIMGLVKPKSGTILFQGTDITSFPPYKTAKIGIGYVPEERRIFPNLSVLDNLRMGIKHGAAAKTAGQNKWTIDRI